MEIIDYFTRIYSSIKDKHRILSKLKIYSLQRLTLRLLVNFFAPILFVLTREKNKNSSGGIITDKRVIISLTSFPARINRVWLTIECLMRQSYKPDKIVLWLSSDQFKGVEYLPKNLLRLMARGLEIRICEGDLRSHKKYYYAMKCYSNDIIVTVDDDVLYPSFFLRELIALHKEFPNEVCCHFAHRIIVKGANIEEYKNWDSLTKTTGPSFSIFPVGCGGVLYPPNVLNADVFKKEIFMDVCLYADDVWLNAMAQRNNVMAVRSNTDYTFLPILNFNNKSLTTVNVNLGQNDKQIAKVRELYLRLNERDPYFNLYN